MQASWRSQAANGTVLEENETQKKRSQVDWVAGRRPGVAASGMKRLRRHLEE